MQVQKINNSQLAVNNYNSNRNLHNVQFRAYGEEFIQRLISKQGKNSPIGKLLRHHKPYYINKDGENTNLKLFQPYVEYVHEFARSKRFYRPNIYIGSSFYDDFDMCPAERMNAGWFLNKLKEKGIKTIIDLDDHIDPMTKMLSLSGIGSIVDLVNDSNNAFKEIVEQKGLKYYSYPIWDAIDYTEHSIEMLKDMLVDFIKEMQKDNIYICSHSVKCRDMAAMINTWFNPKFIRGSARVSRDGMEVAHFVESFAQKINGVLTEKDQRTMNWPPEFGKRFKERLELCEEQQF